jgi:hypothetical protein
MKKLRYSIMLSLAALLFALPTIACPPGQQCPEVNPFQADLEIFNYPFKSVGDDNTGAFAGSGGDEKLHAEGAREAGVEGTINAGVDASSVKKPDYARSDAASQVFMSGKGWGDECGKGWFDAKAKADEGTWANAANDDAGIYGWAGQGAKAEAADPTFSFFNFQGSLRTKGFSEVKLTSTEDTRRVDVATGGQAENSFPANWNPATSANHEFGAGMWFGPIQAKISGKGAAEGPNFSETYGSGFINATREFRPTGESYNVTARSVSSGNSR